ncbi:hypothetical protein [Streptomyces sp. NBC_01304]|uniref:hypothetical protein n=1 Tax=Streptomyces sp. NBC_01304 TaxID=2903818 RepID=UPI002E14D278|nr:hypothetical protein OG430_44695 [Streptomyces sp. NBC_01304]
MADEVSYNPDLFAVTNEGDLKVSAQQRKWPYPGIPLAEGNGLKYDQDGLFVDLPATVYGMSYIQHAADLSGPVDIPTGGAHDLGPKIPAQVWRNPGTRPAVVSGGWSAVIPYTVTGATAWSGTTELRMSVAGHPTTDPIALASANEGLVGVLAAYVPVQLEVPPGGSFSNEVVTCYVSNTSGATITIDWTVMFAAHILEGLTS